MPVFSSNQKPTFVSPRKASWIRFGVNAVLLGLVAITVGIFCFFLWPSSFSLTVLLFIAAYSFLVAPAIFFVCSWVGW